MARFLKQSFAQTCLKETDNGKLHQFNLIIIEMSPRFVLGRENVPCVAEVVNRSLKADCTDFTNVNVIIVLIAVQLDLRAVNTINWNRN